MDWHKAVVNPTQYIDIDISWLVNGKWGLTPLTNQVGNSKLSTTPGAMHGIPDILEKGGWHWVDSRLLAMFFDLLAGVKNCLPGEMNSDGNIIVSLWGGNIMAEICRNHIQSRLDNLLYFLVGGNYMNCLVDIFRSHRCFATDCNHKCSYFEEVFRWRNPAVVGASQIHPVLLFFYPAVVGVVLILSISEEDWIGLRDNLQETIDFPKWNMGLSGVDFPKRFPRKPIHLRGSLFWDLRAHSQRRSRLRLWTRRRAVPLSDPGRAMASRRPGR